MTSDPNLPLEFDLEEIRKETSKDLPLLLPRKDKNGAEERKKIQEKKANRKCQKIVKKIIEAAKRDISEAVRIYRAAKQDAQKKLEEKKKIVREKWRARKNKVKAGTFGET